LTFTLSLIKEINALHTRLRFFRHFYQLLLKFNRRETAAAASTVNVNMLIDEILKSTHVCKEALNSSLQTVSLGSGYGNKFAKYVMCLI
jgi:hypothetical protein